MVTGEAITDNESSLIQVCEGHCLFDTIADNLDIWMFLLNDSNGFRVYFVSFNLGVTKMWIENVE